MLVPAAGDNKGRPSILGIDKRSGLVRWEAVENNSGGGNAVWGLGSTHGYHMSPHLMRLPGGKVILVSNMGNLIDPETGASLGQMPNAAAGNNAIHEHWGAGFLTSVQGTLVKCMGDDRGNGPFNFWQISLGTDGKAVIGAGYSSVTKGSGGNPFALSDRLLVHRSSANLLDPATGAVRKSNINQDPNFSGGGESGSITIAGHYLVGAKMKGQPGSDGKSSNKVGSPAVAQLTTTIYDVTDLATAKKVGENVLTIPGFTPDISAKHFPKAAELYPTAEMIISHVNYQGIGFNFAVDTSGLTAIGSRIYLHSPSMLICIGQE